MYRDIIHINVADFPVAVERVLEPRLQHRPVAVAVETTQRALIFSLSSEAARAGVWRGMPLYQARKVCRDLTVLPPNPELYTRATRAMIEVLSQFSPIIEPGRYGHAYLDMTGSGRLFGRIQDAGARAQQEIQQRLRLDTAVGLAGNKMVSKIATEVVQPRGLHAVRHGDEEHFLAPLSVSYLPGINRQVKTQLLELNVQLIRQLAGVAVPHLTAVFGRLGVLLHQRALGIDHSPVQPPKQIPEICEQEHLAEDSNDFDRLRCLVFAMIVRATRQLRSNRQRAARLILKVQYSDYKESAGQQRLHPTDQDTDFFPIVRDLLQRILTRRVRVRKLTLQLRDFSPIVAQLSLFEESSNPKNQRLTRAMDGIRDRFGENAIGFGTGIKKSKQNLAERQIY